MWVQVNEWICCGCILAQLNVTFSVKCASSSELLYFLVFWGYIFVCVCTSQLPAHTCSASSFPLFLPLSPISTHPLSCTFFQSFPLTSPHFLSLTLTSPIFLSLYLFPVLYLLLPLSSLPFIFGWTNLVYLAGQLRIEFFQQQKLIRIKLWTIYS